MPYINTTQRAFLDHYINELVIQIKAENLNDRAGCLNYCIFKTVKGLLRGEMCYNSANSLIGAIECCKQEIYRRILSPYEDKKIEQNGDVL